MRSMARRRKRTRRGLSAAIGLGLAGGMRTFVPPAAIALRDRRPDSRVLRLAVLLASAGELAADKHPSAPSRTDPVGLAGRLAASGSVGLVCAGPLGGLFAGGAAIASAFAMHAVRGELGERTGLPDPVLGSVEDSLAFAIARAATRRAIPRKAIPAPPAPPAEPAAPPTTAAEQVAAKPPAAKTGRPARRRAKRRRRRWCRLCRRSPR
jgi:hypothetical protein